MDRTGMYWGDFVRFIERNKKNWRYIHYYKSKDGFPNTRSICDFSYPYRNPPKANPIVLFAENWYQKSFVCNASDFEGWIPLADRMYLWHEEQKKWVTRPARGLKGVVKMLVGHDCLDKTTEVNEVLNARTS
jgi:hypothetical protein